MLSPVPGDLASRVVPRNVWRLWPRSQGCGFVLAVDVPNSERQQNVHMPASSLLSASQAKSEAAHPSHLIMARRMIACADPDLGREQADC